MAKRNKPKIFVPAEITDDRIFLNLDEIDKYECRYNIFCGSRCAGKTYQYKIRTLDNALRDRQTAYVRRYDEDIKPSKIATLWDDVYNQGIIKKYGEKIAPGYDDYNVFYKGSVFYLIGINEGEAPKQIKAISRAASMSKWIRYKSNNYDNCDDCFFEEFLTSEEELSDEFKKFENMVSTICRQRKCHIYLFGNTVSRDSQILKGMGINARDLQIGVSIYEYKEIDPETHNYLYNSVCVNNYGSRGQNEETKSMFIFNNQKSKRMIVGGEWEHEEYNKIPIEIIMQKPHEIPSEAVRLCKNDMTLYVYEMNDYIYVSDKRLKPRTHVISYVTIWDGITDEKRNCFNFNCQAAAIINYCNALSDCESLGKIYFNSDLAGEDFSRNILQTTPIKE